MPISSLIEQIATELRRGRYANEASVSQGILLPVLHSLGWPIFNTNIVVPEFSVGGRRVDYALCHPPNKPCVFIEVKNVGLSEGADKQLFEYAFHLGVPMAVLTDGQEWSFYLPGERGLYNERRVYKIDLIERENDEVIRRLDRYLNYEHVVSGDSLKHARADYQDVSKGREIASALPRAWQSLLQGQDSLLLDMLAEKVEDLCGYKPDVEVCGKFIASCVREMPEPPQPMPVQHEKAVPRKRRSTPPVENASIDTNAFFFKAKGIRYPANNARDLMVQFFRFLAAEDARILEAFIARKHGKKRRYLARDRQELYPDRPDLAEEHAIEIAPGWWLGLNYSRSNIRQILDLALEVIPSKLRSTIQINL